MLVAVLTIFTGAVEAVPPPEALWIGEDVSLEEFRAEIDDWYYPAEEQAERARLTVGRGTPDCSGGPPSDSTDINTDSENTHRVPPHKSCYGSNKHAF